MKRYLIPLIILFLLLIGSGVWITQLRTESTSLLQKNDALHQLNIDLRNTNAAYIIENTELSNRITILEQKLEDAQNTISYCYRVTHPQPFPSLEALFLWLEWDTTNNNQYVEGAYMCIDFAVDVMRNARAEGYLVSIEYDPQGAHMINSALVGEDTIVFFEPQTDELLFQISRHPPPRY